MIDAKRAKRDHEKLKIRGYEELKKLWDEIKEINTENLQEAAFIEDKNLINKIRFIIRGKTVSYRYALLTQLLAKTLDPTLNALALQKKAHLKGSFDARSFCRAVVVEFEKDHLENILGGSHDPYVSKPLRHESISLDLDTIKEIKDKEGWRALYDVLKVVQEKNDVEFTRRVLKQVLLEIRRLLVEIQASEEISISAFSISPTLIDLNNAINRYLEEPSEGARAQAIVYALINVANKRIKAFKDIRTTKSTVADKYAGKFADIECIGENEKMKVGISVTEVLDYRKLREELDKSIQRNVNRLILLAHKIKLDPRFQEIINHYMRNYKIDVVVESIAEFISIFTTILNDRMREEFILEVIKILRELGYQDHLIDWIKILKDMKLIKDN